MTTIGHMRLSRWVVVALPVLLAGGSNVVRDLGLLLLAAAGWHPLPLYGFGGVR